MGPNLCWPNTCRYIKKDFIMRTATLNPPARSGLLPWLVLGLVLLAWGAGVIFLAEAQGLRQGLGQPPFKLAASILVPVGIVALAWRLVPAIRRWTDSWDLAMLVGIQTFRVIGIVFLFVWWLGDLPTIFAWVAALGDIAVGILALPATVAVALKSSGWQTRVRRLTYAGLADFAVVLSLGALSAEGRPLQFPGEPSAVAMQMMPMVMIPGFLVPIFILLLLLQYQRSRA
jgi:hypothetical protein